MTSIETALQPLSWELTRISEEVPPTLGLVLPDDVRTRIRALSGNSKMPDISKLYHILRALDAGIIDITSGSFSREPSNRPPFWIYASTRAPILDTERLTQAIAAWMMLSYPGIGHRTARELHPDAFAWQQIHLGTTPTQLARKILPSLYTHLLLETNTPILLTDRDGTPYQWHLRRAPSSDAYTAELVSYPPDLYRGKYPFSYSLKFSIATLPGTPSLFLTCRPGVRRWVGWPAGRGKAGFHDKRQKTTSSHLRSHTIEKKLNGLPVHQPFSNNLAFMSSSLTWLCSCAIHKHFQRS